MSERLTVMRLVSDGLHTVNLIAKRSGIKETHVMAYLLRLKDEGLVKPVRVSCDACGKRHTEYVPIDGNALARAWGGPKDLDLRERA